MPQNIVPVESTQAHQSIAAPPGTKRYTVESVTGPGGVHPYVAYPILGHPHLDTRFVGVPLAQEGQVRIRRVPPEVAANDLAWWPTSPAPRLATDQEVTAYLAERAHGGQG